MDHKDGRMDKEIRGNCPAISVRRAAMVSPRTDLTAPPSDPSASYATGDGAVPPHAGRSTSDRNE